MLSAFLAALVGVCAAQAAPGPNTIAVASAGLGQGRRAAFFVVLGIASGVLVWAAAVAFGLSALFKLVPMALTIMKILGGLYLLYIAVRAFQASLRGGGTKAAREAGRLTAAAAWRRGFLVVMTNPKAALMWCAVAMFLFGLGLTSTQVLAFGPVGALSALTIYGLYAFLFSTEVATRLYGRFARGVEALMGAAFGAFGLVLLGAGVRELRR
ncbi:LysE family translocator [Consotaella aegiceratis]|uniref:LysE family translocator n=1 Tax=Consotaella aegiceratis TaxID=3097961 RepID=UPI002F405E39